MERAALRSYLRRKMNRPFHNETTVSEALNAVLMWVLSRQRRYDKKPGGLGR
jgi:hypothetical protein